MNEACENLTLFFCFFLYVFTNWVYGGLPPDKEHSLCLKELGIRYLDGFFDLLGTYNILLSIIETRYLAPHWRPYSTIGILYYNTRKLCMSSTTITFS